jgi:predicted RNase H-like HicB family nuclease
MKKYKHFPIVIEQDTDGVYIVECPSFQGCRSYGMTIDEAMENIREAILVCVEEDEHDDTSTFVGIRDLEVALV